MKRHRLRHLLADIFDIALGKTLEILFAHIPERHRTTPGKETMAKNNTPNPDPSTWARASANPEAHIIGRHGDRDAFITAEAERHFTYMGAVGRFLHGNSPRGTTRRYGGGGTGGLSNGGTDDPNPSGSGPGR